MDVLLEVIRPTAVPNDPGVELHDHVPAHTRLALGLHVVERVLEVLEVVGAGAPALAWDVEPEVGRVQAGGHDEQARIRIGRGQRGCEPELSVVSLCGPYKGTAGDYGLTGISSANESAEYDMVTPRSWHAWA
jgi:hypothetical protein